MRIASILAFTAAAVVASGVIGAPANAVEHCPDQTGKVEIDGGPTVNVDLAEGTLVCIKAGTKIAFVEVQGGQITNTTIFNKSGRPLGISYYVPGEEPEPPCEPTYYEPCE